jgi:hypothetical protein
MKMLTTFEDLLGKTLKKIENINNEYLIFQLKNNHLFCLYHEQDCCEKVTIEDICGDLNDLINVPILLAELIEQKNPEDRITCTTSTWSFYKLSTIKGSVTIRWYGSSEGEYSETVNWKKITYNEYKKIKKTS